MRNLSSYDLYYINESFDYKLYETKSTSEYFSIQKDVLKKLSLKFYFIGTFQMGISALYPIVQSLIKNEAIKPISKEQVVLLTIFALTQILHVFGGDVMRLREELKEQGIDQWIEKVKQTILSLGRLFKFVAQGFGKVIDAFTDVLAYVSLAIPFYAVVLELINLNGLDMKTIFYKLGMIGTGVGILSIKSIMNKMWYKIKEKGKLKEQLINEGFLKKKPKKKEKTLKDWVFEKPGEPPMTFTPEEEERFKKEFKDLMRRVINKNIKKRIDPYSEEKWEEDDEIPYIK